MAEHPADFARARLEALGFKIDEAAFSTARDHCDELVLSPELILRTARRVADAAPPRQMICVWQAFMHHVDAPVLTVTTGEEIRQVYHVVTNAAFEELRKRSVTETAAGVHVHFDQAFMGVEIINLDHAKLDDGRRHAIKAAILRACAL